MSMTGSELIHAIEWHAADTFPQTLLDEIQPLPAFEEKRLVDVSLVFERPHPTPLLADELHIRAASALDIAATKAGRPVKPEVLKGRVERMQRVAALMINTVEASDVAPGSLIVERRRQKSSSRTNHEGIYHDRISIGTLEGILDFMKLAANLLTHELRSDSMMLRHHWELRHSFDLPVNGREPRGFLHKHAAWLREEANGIGIRRVLYGQRDLSGEVIPEPAALEEKAERIEDLLAEQ